MQQWSAPALSRVPVYHAGDDFGLLHLGQRIKHAVDAADVSALKGFGGADHRALDVRAYCVQMTHSMGDQ